MRTSTVLWGTAVCLLGLGCPIAGEKVGSYEEKVAARQQASRPSSMSQADRDTMKKAAEDLAAAMPEPGLKVGDKAPDFTLPNATELPVTLSVALKQGPVVLVFYRGAWCPFCNLHLQSLQESLKAFQKHDATLIAVSPQRPDKSLEQIGLNPLGFEVLSDLDDSVMKAYKLYFEVPRPLADLYKNKFKLDLTAYNGPDRYGLPVPGTFVIDRSGIIRFADAHTDYRRRTEPADILYALEKLPAAP